MSYATLGHALGSIPDPRPDTPMTVDAVVALVLEHNELVARLVKSAADRRFMDAYRYGPS